MARVKPDFDVISVPWESRAALRDVELLEPMAELAYRRILDLIFQTNNAVPDDDRAMARFTKTGRKWKAIKAQLVPDYLQVVDGHLCNEKATRTLAKVHKNVHQKRAAGNASAEKRKAAQKSDKPLENNKTTATGVATNDTTDAPTSHKPIANSHIAAAATMSKDVEDLLQGFAALLRMAFPDRAACWTARPCDIDAAESMLADERLSADFILQVVEERLHYLARANKPAPHSLGYFAEPVAEAVASAQEVDGKLYHPDQPLPADVAERQRYATLRRVVEKRGIDFRASFFTDDHAAEFEALHAHFANQS